MQGKQRNSSASVETAASLFSAQNFSTAGFATVFLTNAFHKHMERSWHKGLNEHILAVYPVSMSLGTQERGDYQRCCQEQLSDQNSTVDLAKTRGRAAWLQIVI